MDKFSFKDFPVNSLAKELDKIKKETITGISPENEALTFYMMNHGFHLIKNKYSPLEILPINVQKLIQEHLKITNDIAKRLFTYIILISVEEARFLNLNEQKTNFFSFLESSYGIDFISYVKNNFRSSKKSGSLLDFQNLGMNIGAFLDGMTAVFSFGTWTPGYGGKSWSKIVGLSRDVVKGNQSFEMMADLAFSLAHNNGSMFNKGHIYNMYTPFIYEILDIQDSGQIPQWINSNKNNTNVGKDLLLLHEKLSKEFPIEFTGKVNDSLIKDSSKKRNLIQQQKLIQAQWNGNWNNNSNDINIKRAPEQKIDSILIDTFKGNNWIK